MKIKNISDLANSKFSSLIQGDVYLDERGIVRFVNDFDMSKVVRMYAIEPNFGSIRAWQGHKKEKKWFYAAKGAFLIKLVQMESLEKQEFILTSKESQVLEIPGYYYNGFEALEEQSVLIVFSDFPIANTKDDDFRESIDILAW